MSAVNKSHPARRNHLLSLLPDRDLQQLLPQLQLVHTEFKQVLTERDNPIEYVYFPCDGVFSILTFMQNGTGVEVATVGNEGFSGVELLIGSELATGTITCKVAGSSLRMRASGFKEAIDGDTPLRTVTQRFFQTYLSQISQSVACNRLHSIEERFSRWVLMTHDRITGEHFQLTQEFLADMLGVHRPSVSLVAGAFQQAGLIKYSRGALTILNREGIEDICCECYAAVKGRLIQPAN
jgi:CRP-like cAMP-binding protein